MGEVYRARDTRLGREVALKLLSKALAEDSESLARFEREARLLASVEHPNIAVIHGLEEAGGVRFLVLELVDGETLAEKLAAGPLPVGDALRLGAQIAGALEAAHEKGVIHRDLKPTNVKITPAGRAKVLDFGLAKSVENADSGLSAAATISAAGTTREGTVLGTPAYMSPEQARGRPVDRKTDVWSFGCVLYEMLAGRRAFSADTASDTLVAVLSQEPDLSLLPHTAPESVVQLLRRCLEKDSARRPRDAGDIRLQIEEALARLDAPAGRREAGGGLSGLVRPLASLFSRRRSEAPTSVPTPTARTLALAPKLTQATFSEHVEDFPALSPDGRRLAFSRVAGSVRKIFVKDLDSGEETALTRGERDDIQPDWSPDGERLLFVRAQEPGRRLQPADIFGQFPGADVRALETGTGRESLLVENAANPSFSPDGSRIAFDAARAGPWRIWVADARGRNAEQASSDTSEAVNHLRPRWAPDGARLVFQNVERTKFDVRVLDLASKKLTWVTNDQVQDIYPVWSPSGRRIYFSSYRSGGLNIWAVPVDTQGSPSGPLQQLTTGGGHDVSAAVSRDGKRLAFSILRQNADLWKLPVSPETGQATGAPDKVVATTREDSRGGWSPDGKAILFNSDRLGHMNIWWQPLAGGSARPITKGPGSDFQGRFSPDGRHAVFFSSRSGAVDVWRVDVETGALKQLTCGHSVDVNPIYSPDGRSIAWMSDRTGRSEVWLMTDDDKDARPLSDVGVMGHFLAWTPDGGHVVFRSSTGKSPVLRVPRGGGEPEPVGEVAGGAHLSLSPGGSRIMDVVAHKVLWVSTVGGGRPERVFEFEDADVRIDYPVWSPDGRFVLFDRFRPQGGDVWILEGFE
jgi:Tol biopolymer transport system component/serine/threonine protein kinase